MRKKGTKFPEEKKAGERKRGGGESNPGRRASVEMGLLVFYETCPFLKKVLLDILMFICFNLGLASWKMHEE